MTDPSDSLFALGSDFFDPIEDEWPIYSDDPAADEQSWIDWSTPVICPCGEELTANNATAHSFCEDE